MAHHPTGPQMLTAARLRDGEVIYWKSGDWVPMLADGEVFTDTAAAEAALAAAQAFVTNNEIIEPYLFEVRLDGTRIVPVKEREIIRAAGPTVHKHTGKQAGEFHAE
jgi:Protein of unknown function (DUF2849)